MDYGSDFRRLGMCFKGRIRGLGPFMSSVEFWIFTLMIDEGQRIVAQKWKGRTAYAQNSHV